MDQVNLTLFEHSPQALATIHSLLVQFEQYQQVHVNLTLLPRQGSRRKLLEMTSQPTGTDVVQIDAAWLSEFANLDAFHRLKPGELQVLDGHDHFLRASWQACQVANRHDGVNTWAVPWLADTWCLYYHRDLLEKAGLDQRTAFNSPTDFVQTIAALADKGVRIPLLMPTCETHTNLVHLAMWVWGCGGELMDALGTRPAIDRPEALRGMQAYYQLGKYLPKDVRCLSTGQAEGFFSAGLGAMLLSGSWLVQDPRLLTQLEHDVAIASIPGSSCVSGSHLCIWQGTKKLSASLQLIKFLTSRQAGEQLQPHTGLPVRHDLLETSQYVSSPHYRVFADALRSGRSFPTGSLASILYHQMNKYATVMWKEVFADQRAEPAHIVSRYVAEIFQYFQALEETS